MFSLNHTHIYGPSSSSVVSVRVQTIFEGLPAGDGGRRAQGDRGSASMFLPEDHVIDCDHVITQLVHACLPRCR